MNKVLAAYIACNSLANARKVVAYARKHPFATCLLTTDHVSLVIEAAKLVEREG